MSEKELRAGDFVTSGVRLLRPLAEGGMGRVWIAEHLGLGTEVVVKLMAQEMTARADGASRFAREAAIAAAIKSPHVVQVFDHGIAPEHGVPYIVMELLEGQDLGMVLHERGRLEPTEAAAVVVQVGKALAKAHKAGIIHRDIKPENIFLCAPENEGDGIHAKLLDFGTAKRGLRDVGGSGKPERAATMPGEIMGTPYYMSPEQSVGAMLDERTDIWSLGVVAFEALTGTKPFEGTNVGAIALAIHGPLPRISDRCEDLPPALDAWFARACAQVPQDRFATMREMTAAFVEALTGAAPAASDQTESICLPPRRISVRPTENADDLRKTMPTSIEAAQAPSIPPLAPTTLRGLGTDPLTSEAVAAPTVRPAPMLAQIQGPMPVDIRGPVQAAIPAPRRAISVGRDAPLLDSMSPLAASLPDHASMHRPTRIAAAVVALVAAGVMAAIVYPPRTPAPVASMTLTAAAAPPAAVAPPDPVATHELPTPPAPVDVATPPPPAPAHHKTAKAQPGAKKPAHATKTDKAGTTDKTEKADKAGTTTDKAEKADKAENEDLTRLIEAHDPPAAKPAPAAKPDAPAKPDPGAKPDAGGKPDAAAKPDPGAKPDAGGKPDAAAKPDPASAPALP